MPVVVNQGSVEQQLYEYQVRPSNLTFFSTGIHHRLHIFRSHHQKCAARRKSALRYELRQEEQRTEWLKRKFVDSVRQQQNISSSSRVDQTASSSSSSSGPTSSKGFDLMDHGQHVTEQKDKLPSGDFTELGSTNHHITPNASSPPKTDNHLSKVTVIPAELIKREQEDVEDAVLSSPAKEDTSVITGHGEPKQIASQSKVDKTCDWNSLNGTEDAKDELKLTAYDVIAGVISTPPIQPLEQDADTTCTRSSPTLKPGDSHSNSHTVTTKAPIQAAHTNTLTGKKKDQLSLVKDLDEFSKVMHQVTQEQRAKERRRNSLASDIELSSYSSSQSHSTLLMNQSPPFPMRPLPTHQGNKNFFQQQKYTQHQVHPMRVQSKNVTKPQVLTPGLSSCVGSEPSSSSGHIPATPTTPLEHFSAFSSPPSHLPLPSNQSTRAQACPPPPYSSTTMCYTYGQEPLHQSAASSPATERWSLPALPHQHSAMPDHPLPMHDNGKEHIGSRVMALSGQKRTIHELNSSVVPPPSKHPVGLQGHHRNPNLSSPCGHVSYPCSSTAPFPGRPPPVPASVTFPHQSL